MAWNDFLDAPRDVPREIRTSCNSVTDGLASEQTVLLGLPGSDGADLTMVLHNADGSQAEMSGNGIRCLAQAHAWPNTDRRLSKSTLLGVAHRRYRWRCEEVRVEMGSVGPGQSSRGHSE